MFAIDGGESDAFFFDERHDDLPGGDEDFFAGEGDVFSGVDGGEGGLEADDSGDCDDDEVGFRERGDVDDGLHSAGENVLPGDFLIHEGEFLDFKFGGLGEEFGGGSVGDEADDLEFIGVLADDVEGLGSDASG